MPVKSFLVACTLPIFFACNIQFDLPQSSPEVVEEADPRPPSIPTTPSTSASWETELLDLVNDIRRKGCRCGNKNMKPVPILELNASLNKAAQIHADDMNRNRFFNHTGSDGSSIGNRATKVGFNWRAIGENISEGYPTVNAAFNGWKSSPGHCKNMMSPDFSLMGAANQGSYWVQTFGSPR